MLELIVLSNNRNIINLMGKALYFKKQEMNKMKGGNADSGDTLVTR